MEMQKAKPCIRNIRIRWPFLRSNTYILRIHKKIVAYLLKNPHVSSESSKWR